MGWTDGLEGDLIAVFVSRPNLNIKVAMFPQVPQLIPSELCLECPVCCRFPDREAGMSPFFFPEERTRVERSERAAFRKKEGASKDELVPCGHGFACPFYEPADHTCVVYPDRPLDCAIYPVVVMRGRDGQGVFVGADHKCPALARPEFAGRVREHLKTVQAVLETPGVAGRIREFPDFIGEYQEEARNVRELSLERA